jgi:hypothetical protein
MVRKLILFRIQPRNLGIFGLMEKFHLLVLIHTRRFKPEAALNNATVIELDQLHPMSGIE